MKLFLMDDYCRIDGETGDFLEAEYAADFEKHTEEIRLVHC
ncbi:MAG: hypothetical protein ACK5LX_04375 [Oscillospiraceae bacterium]